MTADTIIHSVIVILCIVVVATTSLPFSGSHAWWIRGWDFPRAQIAALAFVTLFAALFVATGTLRNVMAAALFTCLVYQSYRIFPYTPFAKTELSLAAEADESAIITMFSANVLMENTDHAALIREIDKVDPDIVFLMETDQKWITAVEPVLDRYETVIRVPQDNHYGLVFATRLRTRRAEAIFLVDDRTPSVFAELEDAQGRVLRFVGLHPRPPVPGVDTEERDAQILYAARFARKSNVPLVAMGDFNDAAWSDTAKLFKKVGEYLDPRIGRGLFASFDARSKLLRTPIDHFYLTEEVAVVSFHRGEDFGSDHFPIIAKVDLDLDLARRLNSTPEPIDQAMRDRADDVIAARNASLGIDMTE